MSETSNSSGGIGIFGLLGVLFVGLKLGHVIDWPWLWVLAPFWFGIAVLVLFLLIAGLCVVVAAIFGGRKRYRVR